MAAQRRPPQAPGRGALQSATGGGYRPNPGEGRPNPGGARPNPALVKPFLPAAQAPTADPGTPTTTASISLPKRYAGMDPGVAAERYKMFKAGQLPGQQGGASSSAPPMPGGAPPVPTLTAPPTMDSVVPGFQTGGGFQAPGGAPSSSSPANQPPGIEGAIANLRSQLGESRAGGAAPSGADPMAMIARLRENAQVAQANGDPVGGAAGSGDAGQPPFELARMLGRFGGFGATGMPSYTGGFDPTGKGAAPVPTNLSGLPSSPQAPFASAGLGANPYAGLLRSRLGLAG